MTDTGHGVSDGELIYVKNGTYMGPAALVTVADDIPNANTIILPVAAIDSLGVTPSTYDAHGAASFFGPMSTTAVATWWIPSVGDQVASYDTVTGRAVDMKVPATRWRAAASDGVLALIGNIDTLDDNAQTIRQHSRAYETPAGMPDTYTLDHAVDVGEEDGDADVRALKNHDSNLLLGRTKAGTLELEENKTGLRFKVKLPDTTAGRDVAAEVKRGDITGCSFSFTVEENGNEWLEKDGIIKRTIRVFKRIFDVGPVVFPAYPDTTVAVRSMDQFKADPPEPTEAPEPTDEDPPTKPEGEIDPPATRSIDDMQASVDAATAGELAREIEQDIQRHMPPSKTKDE